MDLQPGPELDRQIHGLLGNDSTGYTLEGQRLVKRSRGMNRYIDLPQYSTTWNGMQLIIEAMNRRDFDVALESIIDTLHAGGTLYHARFFRRIEGDYAEFDSEISFPHAVGMALLRAMQGQDESTVFVL